MADDAGHRDNMPRARRPGNKALTSTAVVLLLGGATAVAIGVLGQQPSPPIPRPQVSHTPVTKAAAPPMLPSPGPSASSPKKAAVSQAVTPLPAFVSIPAIDVQSELITVGLDGDGSLEVPPPGPDYDKAAWFKGSPRPGDVGPATIEGHVDSAKNGPSVFYNLGKLVAGDRINVTRRDGAVETFMVYQVRAFPKADFPTLEVYGNTAGPELRLITCGGLFDSAAGSYVDNTVVFARQD